jgi:hypothetical protein
MQWASEGAWLACELCAGLIELKDYTGLRDRALSMWEVKRGRKPPAGMANQLYTLYALFQHHRQGERHDLRSAN